jgi:hypothetical protein
VDHDDSQQTQRLQRCNQKYFSCVLVSVLEMAFVAERAVILFDQNDFHKYDPNELTNF